MKTYKRIYMWMAALALVLTSCENFLDITPDGQVKRDQLLSSPDGIEDALYGAYATLREPALYGTELSFSALEIMAQYLTCFGNDQVTALSNYRYTDTRVKQLFESVWVTMYKNISNVNSVLTCDLIRDADAYPYTVYRGEALGLRAFMHFDLLRLFTEQITQNPSASGIPYATEFSLHAPEFLPAVEVYRHIVGDLLEAERLLAEEDAYAGTSAFMADRNTHFNLYAVQALLARVYLTRGDKENALAYARKVMAHHGFSLSEKTEVDGDLAGILSNNETIFGVYDAGFYKKVSPLLQQQVTFSSLDPRNDIMTFYEDNVTGLDYRASAYFTAMQETSSAAYRLSKLTDVYELRNNAANRPSDKVLGINLIRLPEMYYIAAECLLDADYDEAVRLFDEMLEHRGLEKLANWPAPQNVLTVDAINAERYREFIGEGQTFFNMKRQNLPVSAVDGQTTIAPSKEIFVVPVPDIEFDYRQ